MTEIKVQWPHVIEIPDHAYINRIDLGNYTAFNLVAFKTFKPREGLFIALEAKSNYLFPCDKPIHWEYAAEKLALCQADARIIADFINAQIWQPYPQQGVYYKDVVLYEDPLYRPYKPEIIND